MPCCALAAFVVGQIVIGFDALRRFVLGRSAAERIVPNPSAEWRLFAGQDSGQRSSRSMRPVRWFAIAAVLEAALLVAGAWGIRSLRHHQHSFRRAEVRAPAFDRAVFKPQLFARVGPWQQRQMKSSRHS
jgi:hypothetical protein